MTAWWKSLCLIVLSALLQTLVFPVAGPLPHSRAQLAWLALVPWFYLLLRPDTRTVRDVVRLGLWSYLCGVLWYAGHCYWIFATMHQYGGLSTGMAVFVLLLFCFYLGLYHAAFGLMAGMLRRRWNADAAVWPLLLALLWTGVEFGRAHITSFPWDLLGYSQIDNAALTAMAPWTGVYGIGFTVAVVNGLFVSALVRSGGRPFRLAVSALIAATLAAAGYLYHPMRDKADASAVLVQPNLVLGSARASASAIPLESEMQWLTDAALQRAGGSAAIVLWPEAPASYELNDVSFVRGLTMFSTQRNVSMIVDANAVEPDGSVPRRYRLYNSAGMIVPGKGLQQRYDKIHLVPFGEFTPFADLFGFASGLTQEVGTFDRGNDRSPLTDGRHRFGTFICYESIFPEEVLQPVRQGADVLVNLSDDGWYGDTSAPFQHINMARMRAIENRRWLLRDTNTGITASIDPEGNIREAVPRHVRTAAVMHFAYRNTLTFYTRHGDVFACACTVLAIALLAFALMPLRSRGGKLEPC